MSVGAKIAAISAAVILAVLLLTAANRELVRLWPMRHRDAAKPPCSAEINQSLKICRGIVAADLMCEPKP